MDNRFAFMRKHLGISQKDASKIFNVRLDTIKKWDADRLHVPSRVLEDLYDLVERTSWLIQTVVDEYNAIDEDDDLAEIYLHIPDEGDLGEMDLPESMGWVEHVIGALIGNLPSIHVYGTKEVPAHADLGFNWYGFWAFDPAAEVGFLTIGDEAVFAEELDKAIERKTFRVEYNGESNHYYMGFPTRTIGKQKQIVWIKGMRGGKYRLKDDDLSIEFYDAGFGGEEGQDTPFVRAESGERETVGLATDRKEISDAYSLAELIYFKLKEHFQTEGALLEACRQIMGEDFTGDDEIPSISDSCWELKDKYILSHNLIVAIYLAVREGVGLALLPESLQGLCDIITRSEPVAHQIDEQTLVIDMGDIEVEVQLDLRDIVNTDETGKKYGDEWQKAVQVIMASVQSDCDEGMVSVLPARSRISVTARGELAE